MKAFYQTEFPRTTSGLRVVNSATVAEVFLYDEISMFGITAQDFTAQLRDITAPTISLRINSPGGDVFDGVAMYSALKNHPATVDVTVDGLAASAASFVAMAGDTIRMGEGAMMMVHDAIGFTLGNAEDHAKQVDLLNKVSDEIAGFYARRTGVPQAEWRAIMKAETWYNSDEAVAIGLADGAQPQDAHRSIFDLVTDAPQEDVDLEWVHAVLTTLKEATL